jgi:hypothetical protein
MGKFAFGPLARRAVTSSFSLCVVLVFVTRSLAGVGNFCPFGPCVPDHETIINLYWDSDLSQWDSHTGGPASGLTAAQLDKFTAALVHSSYFSQLQQYHVDNLYLGPTLSGADCKSTPSAAALPTDVDAANSGGIDALIGCILKTNTTLMTVDAAIINVFLPPQVVNKTSGFCSPKPDGTHAAAMHNGSSVSNRLSWTVIPTTAACNGSVGSVTVSLSHEMAEAATDPTYAAASGWKAVADGEIADLCEDGADHPHPSAQFLFGLVTQYWSNSANACVTGFASSAPPTISSAMVCGAGRNMQITLLGTFGAAPWDLAPNSGKTAYVRASVNGSWGIGDLLGPPPDSIGFANIAWTKGAGPSGADVIKINGFDSGYGAGGHVARSGDSISITVVNPDNGAVTATTIVAPNVSAVRYFGAPTDLRAGETGGISGQAIDSAGCSTETSLQIQVGPNPFINVDTLDDGWFSTNFTAPDIAGNISISVTGVAGASATTHVHPRLDSLTQPRGDVAGGQVTVLNGLGFDAMNTRVVFSASSTSIQSVSSDHKTVTLLTPSSPIPGVGTVPVEATVNGVDSSPLNYDYVNTGVPVFEFVDANGAVRSSPTCNVGDIRVEIFDANGAPRSGSVLLSASYPAFWVPRSAFLGQWQSSITAALGSIVTISGGGPVTAVDTAHASSKGTESFPVWPRELCEGVKFINTKISQILWKAPKLYASSPSCSGDCGTGGATVVFWADAEDLTKARNYVSIRGDSAEEIQSRYKVDAVASAVRNKLVLANPFIADRRSLLQQAVFVGPMVDIEPQKSGSGKSTPVNGGLISFALPGGSSAYGIVHLRDVDGRQAWVEESKSVVDEYATHVQTKPESVGIYALVQIVSP